MSSLRNFEHQQLLSRIADLNQVPASPDKYETWISASDHLDFLRTNADSEELIIFARAAPSSFVHAVLVSEECMTSSDQETLLHWRGSPLVDSCASYNNRQGNIYINRSTPFGPKSLRSARPLVFGREFSGLGENRKVYYEILQEYLHVTDIHWCPARDSYCRFDENGDHEAVVSVTSKPTGSKLTLISFRRTPLEAYLTASNSVLVQMFDFILGRKSFESWHLGEKKLMLDDKRIFYSQKIIDHDAGLARGIQIIRPRHKRSQILASLGEKTTSREHHEEFVALDFRKRVVIKISTDPDSTTDHFQAETNTLPSELSPAFFDPEVLIKYKSDPEKYTVSQYSIACRGGWQLSYGVNEAGQVHAYICDLRYIPAKEKVYWRSFNQPPRTSISEASFRADFLAQWPNNIEPLQEILDRLMEWNKSTIDWWKSPDRTLFQRISTPRTSSRKEWSDAFIILSQLVVEGFSIGYIRAKLDENDIEFSKEEKSLSLIKKILKHRNSGGENSELTGLTTAQLIRSKAGAHAGGSKAESLANDALKKYGTYSDHFESICKKIAQELDLIEKVML